MLSSCRRAAEQLSEHMDEPLTGLKWFKLKFHILVCVYCRRYGKQLEISAKTLNQLDSKTEPSDSLKREAIEHFRDCHSGSKNNS